MWAVIEIPAAAGEHGVARFSIDSFVTRIGLLGGDTDEYLHDMSTKKM